MANVWLQSKIVSLTVSEIFADARSSCVVTYDFWLAASQLQHL